MPYYHVQSRWDNIIGSWLAPRIRTGGNHGSAGSDILLRELRIDTHIRFGDSALVLEGGGLFLLQVSDFGGNKVGSGNRLSTRCDVIGVVLGLRRFNRQVWALPRRFVIVFLIGSSLGTQLQVFWHFLVCNW